MQDLQNAISPPPRDALPRRRHVFFSPVPSAIRAQAFVKYACQHALAALALLCCIQAGAAPYPTEDQLRTAIGEVAGLLKSEGLELEILDAREEGVTQPLMAAGLSKSSGACLVFFNTNPQSELNHFFGIIDQKDLPVLLNGIAVHEATHCIEQREAYVRKRFDKILPPEFKRDNVTIQSYLSAVKSGAIVTWSEALADIATVLYLKRAVPDRWLHLSNRIAAMRHGFAWKWPAHDTSAWLHKIIAADIGEPENQSLFEMAFQLRGQYRPDK